MGSGVSSGVGESTSPVGHQLQLQRAFVPLNLIVIPRLGLGSAAFEERALSVRGGLYETITPIGSRRSFLRHHHWRPARRPNPIGEPLRSDAQSPIRFDRDYGSKAACTCSLEFGQAVGGFGPYGSRFSPKRGGCQKIGEDALSRS